MFVTLLYLFLMSVLTAILYIYDKRCAEYGRWRVPENTLLLFAALGGASGALWAMYVYRHKTQKEAFAQGVPFLIVIQTVLIIIIANIFL